MSLSELIEADVETVFLNLDDFAEVVTHRPGGVAANDVARTVVWEELEPTRVTERGEEIRRRATVHVAEAATVTPADQWIKGGEIWATTTIEGPEGGMQTVTVQRLQDATRSRTGGGLL